MNLSSEHEESRSDHRRPIGRRARDATDRTLLRLRRIDGADSGDNPRGNESKRLTSFAPKSPPLCIGERRTAAVAVETVGVAHGRILRFEKAGFATSEKGCEGGPAGLVMQVVVTWWCTLIGITDPFSIQIASGIVGGSTLIYSPFLAWWLFSAIIARLVR
jgi:hypothetical protein